MRPQVSEEKIDERNSIVLVRKHGCAIETVDGFDFTQFVALLDKQGVFLDLVDEQLTLVFGIVLGDFLVLFGSVRMDFKYTSSAAMVINSPA